MIQSYARYIQPYIELIENFTNNQINAQQFEKSFLELFKNDSTEFSEKEYEVLNNIFYDVEDFCADPTIRDKEDLDEQQLKIRSKQHLKTLYAL